jgi:serine protease Do
MNRQRLWSNRKLLGLVLASGLAIGAYGAARASRNVGPDNPTPTLRLADPNEGPSRNTFAPVVKRVLPAVVNISSSKLVKTPAGFGSMQDDDMFRRFFGDQFGNQSPYGQRGRGNRAPRQQPQQREQGLGSGVIVSPEGYVLTNNHVVDGASDIKVSLGDGREFQGRVVGADAKSDIAVVKIDADHLSYITIGDSAKVQIGDQVLAIGDPFGVGQTVTAGIVSATQRGGLGIEDYEDFIQTDAPINPGNSGGALINDRGELIGINTAILAHGSEGNQGIGFAVPVNLARQVMMELVKNGKVTRGYMGIMLQSLTPAMAKAFGTVDTHGALVGDVTPGSPADRAGLQKGDIIRQVDGKPFDNGNQLRNLIAMQAPGTTVNLKVDRNGTAKTFSVRLVEYPAREERASNDRNSPDNSSQDIQVETLTPETARELNLSPRTKGVVVTGVNPGSKAAESGLRRGDVIQEVNRRPVESEQQFESAMRRAGDNPLLLVNRDGNTLFVAA